MKNNNGFTLVELIAVMVILSLLMLIVVPTVFNSIKKSKTALSSINETNIKEAAKTFATEIVYCESSDFTYSDITALTLPISGFNSSNKYCEGTTCYSVCYGLKKALQNSAGISFKLSYLVDNNYFTNSANCQAVDGTTDKITIIADSNYSITVSLSNIECNN